MCFNVQRAEETDLEEQASKRRSGAIIKTQHRSPKAEDTQSYWFIMVLK